MKFSLRLKALSRLAESNTEAAGKALQNEIDKSSTAVASGTDYQVLERHIEILQTIGHRSSELTARTLLAFIETIDSRLDKNGTNEFQNATSLIASAIDILTQLRYLETRLILHGLIKLSLHSDEKVSRKTLDALKVFAAYDLHVVVGREGQSGIGAAPQKLIIDELAAFTDDQLRMYFSAALTILECLLSSRMEGSSWSYNAVTLSWGTALGLPTVGEIRVRAIELLIRMYGLADSVAFRLPIVSLFNTATRIENGAQNSEAVATISRDSVTILKFFAELVRTEDLQIVQKIESYSYWIFFHTINDDIRKAALAVQAAISVHSEYQVYKVLVGFEGVFGDWETIKRAEDYIEDTDKFRNQKSLEYAQSITPETYGVWKARILKYVETDPNDLATFPVFYRFLEGFAKSEPELAVELITTQSVKIENFLIPLLRSLWVSSMQDRVRKIANEWIQQGNYLDQCVRQFVDNEQLDRDFLVKVLGRAIELGRLRTIAGILIVAVSNYAKGKEFLINDLFLPALNILTEKSYTDWVYDFWFRREARSLVEDLNEEGIKLILDNLFLIKKISYQAEEILYLLAQKNPELIIRFLCRRLSFESKKEIERLNRYEAIPYRLHKLNKPLSTIPTLALQVVREQYDGDYAMFVFRGAHLLQTIFPEFPHEFEAELLNFVKSGQHQDLEFVLGILRNYSGEPFINQVCKAIISAVAPDSRLVSEVRAAMQNTGVVSGEFGLAEAFEQKIDELKKWIESPDQRVQYFAKRFIASLEAMSIEERQQAAEEIALRKDRYGDNT